ncbi:hypothetical protein EJ02DRAFT_464563 [Clathrospora elynae]|uniref:Rhodopsin domain-containing protein n=1 Tax=Clathrospora elynae TaxID=706981 RepID=A0A6A5T4Q7_9PLEO|nr:hypothetical protein EJ02DRAFT_464563 [Clathrospora elynae]
MGFEGRIQPRLNYRAGCHLCNTITLLQHRLYDLSKALARVTAVAIVKTMQLSASTKTRDPTLETTHLAIWSTTELSIGVLIASLPPLRNQLDALLRRILQTTLIRSKSKSRETGGGMPLYNVSKPFATNTRSGGEQSRVDPDNYDDSDRNILQDQSGKSEIMKTVVHEVQKLSTKREGSVVTLLILIEYDSDYSSPSRQETTVIAGISPKTNALIERR